MKVQGLLFYSLFSFGILSDSSLPLKVLFFWGFQFVEPEVCRFASER